MHFRFDLGFEAQVRSVCDHARPSRQCGLFSATFKKRIERLARDCLSDPVKIVQGSVGEASADVRQVRQGNYIFNQTVPLFMICCPSESANCSSSS